VASRIAAFSLYNLTKSSDRRGRYSGWIGLMISASDMLITIKDRVSEPFKLVPSAVLRRVYTVF
jgi:hypothetical protein